MNRRIAAAGVAMVAASGATALALAGSTATASAHSSTPSASPSTEHFFITYGPGEKEVVVAHGPVAGGGKDSSHGNKDVLHLGGGTLTIKHPDSKAHFVGHTNPDTCFAAFTLTGPYTIKHGTGKYVGVTGHGSYKVKGRAILERTAAGTCDQKSNPKVEAASVTASGPLSSPGSGTVSPGGR